MITGYLSRWLLYARARRSVSITSISVLSESERIAADALNPFTMSQMPSDNSQINSGTTMMLPTTEPGSTTPNRMPTKRARSTGLALRTYPRGSPPPGNPNAHADLPVHALCGVESPHAECCQNAQFHQEPHRQGARFDDVHIGCRMSSMLSCSTWGSDAVALSPF